MRPVMGLEHLGPYRQMPNHYLNDFGKLLKFRITIHGNKYSRVWYIVAYNRRLSNFGRNQLPPRRLR